MRKDLFYEVVKSKLLKRKNDILELKTNLYIILSKKKRNNKIVRLIIPIFQYAVISSLLTLIATDFLAEKIISLMLSIRLF